MSINCNAWLKAGRRSARSLKRDERGFTAVEFAMVATPFLMFLFGIINVGLLYFTTFSLENATETTARYIRTGQAKTAGWTQDQFRTQLCNRLPAFIQGSSNDCPNLRVDVQVIADGTTPAPASGTATTTSGGTTTTSLKANSAMSYPATFAGGQICVVTAFYQWDLAKVLPFMHLGTPSLNGGARLIQAMSAFKSEPY